MRRIKGQVTEELLDFIGDDTVGKAEAFPIQKYRDLVEGIAKLAYLNKDHRLFFRGQGQDYRNSGGTSTFYPTIYRGDRVSQREVTNRFAVLDIASKRLRDVFLEEHVKGHEEVRWKKYVQWSLLQHYGVCDTPLLDLTQSLRVACSFAQIETDDQGGYVYAFGLPYVTNRISHNSEHDLVNVRLLSICPPEALRPYFQEGYLAATEDISDSYDDKFNLDFTHRLVAKFRMPAGSAFWGRGFPKIPRSALYPDGDHIEKLCTAISQGLKTQLLPDQLGEFVQAWTDLESFLLSRARDRQSRVFSVREAISSLTKGELLSREQAYQLNDLRKFRNIVVHEPKRIEPGAIAERTEQVRSLTEQVEGRI